MINKTGDDGLALIKQFEGLRLKKYNDIAGFPTIGYGHKITAHDLDKHDTITQEQADELLQHDLFYPEQTVNVEVTANITQTQFDALVCFAYNVGCNALSKSTLLRKLNAGLFEQAANQFLVWNKARVKGQLVEVDGLSRRRQAERNLFLKGE